MGPIGFPETSVIIYHYSLRNSPEERSSVATVGSAHPYRNGQYLKMLKYIKLIPVNCSILILNITIYNTKPPQLPVLSSFILCRISYNKTN
jgi:hypothetical protein